MGRLNPGTVTPILDKPKPVANHLEYTIAITRNVGPGSLGETTKSFAL
jgi:hypothetical protein